jgi:hypothetical protein
MNQKPSPKGLNLNKFKKPPSSMGASMTSAPAVVSKETRTKKVLGQINKLPSLPTVVIQIIRLANDPNSSMTDFEDHIRQDQVLAAKILKLVNSTFYGLSTQINNISRAVVVLGVKNPRPKDGALKKPPIGGLIACPHRRQAESSRNPSIYLKPQL